MSVANITIKHATIAMAYIGARAVHTGLRTLRVQALRIISGTHSQVLDTFTNDIHISNISLFGSDFSKAVAKAASASHDCNGTALSCLASIGPWPPKGRKQKVSTLPPFCGRSQSRN